MDADRTVEKCVSGRLEIRDQSGNEWSVRPPGTKYCEAPENTEKPREINEGKKTVSFFAEDRHAHSHNHSHNNEDFPINCKDNGLNNQSESEESHLKEIDNLTKQLLSKSEEIENLKNQLVAAEEGTFSDYDLLAERDERNETSGVGEMRKQDRKLVESDESHYLQLEGQVNTLQSNLDVKAEQMEQINRLLTQAEDVLMEKEKEISWLNESIFQMEQSLKVNK